MAGHYMLPEEFGLRKNKEKQKPPKLRTLKDLGYRIDEEQSQMVYSNELRAEARKWVEELERLQRLKPTLKTKCKYSGDEAAMFVEIVKGSDGEYLSAAIPISWIKHFFNLENK